MAKRKGRSRSSKRRARRRVPTPAGAAPGSSTPAQAIAYPADRPADVPLPRERNVHRKVVGNQMRTAIASWLLGATASMIPVGLHERLGHTIVDPPLTVSTVLAAALLAMALGVRVPQQVTLWICRSVWMRVTRPGQTSGMAGVVLSSENVDKGLQWHVLAAIMLMAGVTTALLPMAARLVESAWMTIDTHFVWSVVPGACVHAFLLLLVLIVPFATIGLGLSFVHHLACDHTRWGPAASGWFLVGSAAGVAVAAWIMQATARADVVLVVASLPVLVGAIVSISSADPRSEPDQPSRSGGDDLPMWSDRWPTLLRASVVASAVAGAMLLGMATREIGLEPAATARFSVHILGLALGVLLGAQVGRSTGGTIGGFGTVGALCGFVAGVADAGVRRATAPDVLSWVAPTLALAAIGFAFACGQQVVFNRVSRKSGVGGRVLARCLVGGAVGGWIVVPLVTYLAGPHVVAATVALGLIAIGGTLVIHEPCYSPRTRRLRLGTIFLSVIILVVLARSPIAS